MHPQDEEDFNKWYREEHLPMMSKAPGFRRSLQYKLGPKTPQTKDEDPPTYLTIYETENGQDLLSGEAAKAGGTEWTKKHMAASQAFVVRRWQRLHAEGY